MTTSKSSIDEFERQWVDGEQWIDGSLSESEGLATNFFMLLGYGKENMPTYVSIQMWNVDIEKKIVSEFFILGLEDDRFALRRKLWEMLGRLRGINESNQ